MGVADRDYVRKRPRGGDGGPAGGRGLTMTWMLIIANTAVHVVRVFFERYMMVQDKFQHLSEDWLVNVGKFSIGRALFFLQATGPGQWDIRMELGVWRFVTYQFLHADWFHLFFNMFGLFVFGPIVEDAMGRRKFLAFVLVCGVFGALAFVLLNLAGQLVMMLNGGQPVPIPGLLFADPLTPLVGASAGVFGVIMACAHVAPNTLIDIPLPPITVRMKRLAYVYLAIAVVQLLLGSRNAGGEAAHIGGALAGFFFVRRTHLLSDFFNLVGGPSEGAGKGGRKAGRRGGSAKGSRASDLNDSAASRPMSPAEAEVDRILEKVTREGMDSLTDGERRTLEAASGKRRDSNPN